MTILECKRILTIALLKDVRYRTRTPEQCYIDLLELNRMPDDKIREYYNLFFTNKKDIDTKDTLVKCIYCKSEYVIKIPFVNNAYHCVACKKEFIIINEDK